MNNKLEKLAEILKKTDTKTEYDIVGDLEQLQRLYGILKSKDYRKKLSALIEKYKTSEITEIRSALIEKCRKGDSNAIKIYCDYFKCSNSETDDEGSLISETSKLDELVKQMRDE